MDTSLQDCSCVAASKETVVSWVYSPVMTWLSHNILDSQLWNIVSTSVRFYFHLVFYQTNHIVKHSINNSHAELTIWEPEVDFFIGGLELGGPFCCCFIIFSIFSNTSWLEVEWSIRLSTPALRDIQSFSSLSFSINSSNFIQHLRMNVKNDGNKI